MVESDSLAEGFERNRPRLRAVAHRMLGSLAEADDAVQEAWLRASKSDVDEVESLDAWLTTMVARVCLNLLRSRDARREDAYVPDPIVSPADGSGPEDAVLLADPERLARISL
jgi:RNA polymerase sigma factor (sigma-70 family)